MITSLLTATLDKIKIKKPAAPLDQYHHIEELQVGDWFYSVWFVFSFTVEEWEEDTLHGTRSCKVYDFPKEEIKIRCLMGCPESEEELKPMKEIDQDKYLELIDAIYSELDNNTDRYIKD